MSSFALTALVCGSLAWGAGSPPAPAPVSPVLASSGTAVAAAPDPELERLWDAGVPFETFLESVDARRALWETNTGRARLPEEVARRLDALAGRWRILVVTVPGCTDSAFTLPAFARAALYAEAVDLRIVRPDQGGQAVMDARPTSDGRAATPTVVILDEAGNEAGCWIERPAHQREAYLANLKGLERGSPAYNAAAEVFVAWYREDNGASALGELVTLLEAAAGGARGCVTPGGS